MDSRESGNDKCDERDNNYFRFYYNPGDRIFFLCAAGGEVF